MTQGPLVVSYYTENTPYQIEALSLIASCTQHDVEAEIVGVPSAGNWERNCALKPFFIREKLLEKKRSIFWVDADAVFKKKPDFKFLSKSDLSFREMKRFSHDKRFKYCSGSLFINYTPAAIEFMDQWCAYCQEKMDSGADLQFLDQISLADLIERGLAVKICPLPIAYVKVFDLDAHEIGVDEIVIEHLQASRRFRFWQG